MDTYISQKWDNMASEKREKYKEDKAAYDVKMVKSYLHVVLDISYLRLGNTP